MPGTVMGREDNTDLEVIAGGTSGLLKLCAGKSYVEKAPRPDNNPWEQKNSLQDLQREYTAYQRLPAHARLLHLHPDSTPEKLVLPYLPKGSLHQFLRSETVFISSAQRLQFSADAAEGLHLLHCAGIVHGDINSFNFLVDDDIRLRIIDFAGSTIDGEAGSSFEGFRYCLPRHFDDPSTVRTDLFALGSLLFEIATSEVPHREHSDEEVEGLFKKGHFPPTQELPLGQTILGCWQGSYDSAELVHKDIKRVMLQDRN